MSDNPRYSIVLPVYEEESSLPDLYKRLKAVADGLGDGYEMVFVNDGSKDRTPSMLEDMARKDHSVVVVNFTKNFGQHPAIAAGLLQARGDLVITLDADLQNPPEEIPRLVEEMKKGYDMVSGKRGGRKDSLLRKVPSVAVNMMISVLTGLKMEDYGTMLRVFKADVAKRLAREFLRKQAYFTMLISKVTKNVKEIEVSHDERFSGESKYDLAKLFTTFLRIFFVPSKKGTADPSDIYTIGSIIMDGEKTVQ